MLKRKLATAGGQHMDEEATDELIGCERHCFVPIASFDSIVFPLFDEPGSTEAVSAAVN
jgi:hypothetical protein